MEINKETQEIYWQMYEILRRKRRDDKSQIFEAARFMIAAIDEQGNIPDIY